MKRSGDDNFACPCGFFLPHKGGEARMAWDFCLTAQGATGMGLGFLALPRPTLY